MWRPVTAARLPKRRAARAGSEVLPEPRDKGSGIAAHVEGIGQLLRWLTLSAGDPARQETFDWLRARVTANGGTLTVGKGMSANGICSAFRSMSRRLFDRSKSPPSFYALRHAGCAELKASGIGAQEVAQGMGTCIKTEPQKAYETRSQGSGGLRDRSHGIRACQGGPLFAAAAVCISQ